MSSFITYAGVRAKLAAMANRFLRAEDFEALMTKGSVQEVAKYLQTTAMYSKALKDVNTDDIHRRDLEMILKEDLVKDTRKLLIFFVTLDRTFLTYLLRRYEMENLKLAVRNALMEAESKKNVQELEKKFYETGDGKSRFDPVKVAVSSTKEEIVDGLKGTPYQEIVRNVFASHKESHVNIIGAIENALDSWLFSGVLRASADLEYDDYMAVREMVGERADLLNIEWALRAKKFYEIRPEELYNTLIPMNFKLTVPYLHRLCDAHGVKEVLGVLEDGPYRDLTRNLADDDALPHKITQEVRKLLYKEAKKSLSVLGGFSIASFFHYSYLKEYEIMDITTITEGVRYNLKPDEIKTYLIRPFD